MKWFKALYVLFACSLGVASYHCMLMEDLAFERNVLLPIQRAEEAMRWGNTSAASIEIGSAIAWIRSSNNDRAASTWFGPTDADIRLYIVRLEGMQSMAARASNQGEQLLVAHACATHERIVPQNITHMKVMEFSLPAAILDLLLFAALGIVRWWKRP